MSEAVLQWVWVAMAGPRSCGTSRRSSLGGWVGGEEERRRGLRVEVTRQRATEGGGVAERRGEEELGSEVRWLRGENKIGLDGWLKRW